jgi:SOS-response transcriptional repressor LexA
MKHNKQTQAKALHLLEFINQYANDHAGAIPSRREMAIGLGMPENNVSVISHYLKTLESLGLISWEKGRARAIIRSNLRIVTLRACPRDDCQYWTPFFDADTKCPHHGIKLIWRKYQEL